MAKRKENLSHEIRVKVEGVTGWGHQWAIRDYARAGQILHPRLNRAGGVALYIKRGCFRRSLRVGYVPKRTAPKVASLIKKKQPLEIKVEEVLPPSEEWDILGLKIIIRH